MDNKRLITIAIDGFSSSGKSTMAKKKQKKYGRKVKRSGREKLIKYSLEMVPTSLMVGSNG